LSPKLPFGKRPLLGAAIAYYLDIESTEGTPSYEPPIRLNSIVDEASYGQAFLSDRDKVVE
jgi:hypothetical protein